MDFKLTSYIESVVLAAWCVVLGAIITLPTWYIIRLLIGQSPHHLVVALTDTAVVVAIAAAVTIKQEQKAGFGRWNAAVRRDLTLVAGLCFLFFNASTAAFKGLRTQNWDILTLACIEVLILAYLFLDSEYPTHPEDYVTEVRDALEIKGWGDLQVQLIGDTWAIGRPGSDILVSPDPSNSRIWRVGRIIGPHTLSAEREIGRLPTLNRDNVKQLAGSIDELWRTETPAAVTA